MKFKNVSGSNLTVPAIDAYVEAGDVAEVTGDTAESFLQQPDTWRRVDKPKTRTSENTPDGGEG